MRRAAADRMMLLAAAVTVLLSTTLLAAGPIYSDAVTLGSLQRTLEESPVDEANVEIAVPVRPQDVPILAEVAELEIARTFADIRHDVYLTSVSETYGLTDEVEDGVADLALFQYLEGVEDHADIVEGRWPAHTTGVIETAVSEAVAAGLDLTVGSELDVTNRRTQSEVRVVEIVGVYSVRDSSDRFWFGDSLALQGVSLSPSFQTFGPLVVDSETLLQDLTVVNARLRWRVLLDFDEIAVADLPRIGRSIEGLRSRLNEAANPLFRSGEYEDFTVDTRLRPILLTTEQSLSVTRSGVLMLSIQLSILAGIALVFTAGLLVDIRRDETYLLRSWGASNRQVFGIALAEGLLLTVPAALVAPWLAVAGLSFLNYLGPLAAIGLELQLKVNALSYLLAMLAAGGCVLALSIPAYWASRSFGGSGRAKGRQMISTGAQRTGLDVALLGLAVLGFWQLSVHGEAITAAAQGRLGVDPLLVATPSVGLIAGAVFALRAVPLLARLSDAMAGTVRSAVPALAAWQVSRRPLRYARSSLLLILAIGIGLFTATYTATWNRSQDDQAAFEVGADVTVTPDRRAGGSVGALHLRDAYEEVESVEAVMPLARLSSGGADTGSIRRFMFLDAAVAGDVVNIRDDIGPEFVAAMRVLNDRRPAMASVPLPGEPERVGVDIGVEVVPLPEDVQFDDDVSLCFCPSLRIVLQDADGLLHRIDLGPIPVDAGVQRLGADLVLRLDEARVSPRYPLSVVDLEIRSPTPLDVDRSARITFAGVLASSESSGDAWTVATGDLDQEPWVFRSTPVAGAIRQPSMVMADAMSESMSFDVTTGRASGNQTLPAFFGIRPFGTSLGDTFPIVTTERYLTETTRRIGDGIRLRGLRIPRDRAEIVATVTDFPTVDPEGGEAVIIDFATFQMVSYELGRQIADADEYWLSTDSAAEGDGSFSQLEAVLRAQPYRVVEIVSGGEVAELRRTDAIALGTMGALALGFVAAAIFAVVGFTVSATVSARERMGEFALLRAIGVSNRQLGSWLVLEQAVLVVVSIGLGTLIGLLLSWVALPLITVTQEGSLPVPSIRLVFPWRTILLLDAAVVGFLTGFVAILVGLLRRIGLGSTLRLGVD